MDKKLETLYRELGWRGTPRDTRQALASGGGMAASPARPAAAGDSEPLAPEGLGELERELREDPEELLRSLREMLRYPITSQMVVEALAELRVAFEAPDSYLTVRQLQARALLPWCNPPREIQEMFPDIPVNPCDRKFEPVADLTGWILFGLSAKRARNRGDVRIAGFPKHDDPGNTTGFVYRLCGRDGGLAGADDMVRLALFGDFGTGLYYSRFIARQIAGLHPAYAIHLGDVYYAGQSEEVRSHLADPLQPLLAGTRVFVLNANHEMYAGGVPYFTYLEQKRQAPTTQEQEGSYFCLRSDRYSVIALDADYDWRNEGRLLMPTQVRWLAEQLREGRRNGGINILLTQHEPYQLGALEPMPLLRDLAACAKDDQGRWMIDYWFWGDEHYCALFEPTAAAPFVGSCIGHAGHPIYWGHVIQWADQNAAGNRFARTEWVERDARFPDRIFDNNRGNPGFCVLELGPTGVGITYYDWLGRERYRHPLRP